MNSKDFREIKIPCKFVHYVFFSKKYKYLVLTPNWQRKCYNMASLPVIFKQNVILADLDKKKKAQMTNSFCNKRSASCNTNTTTRHKDLTFSLKSNYTSLRSVTAWQATPGSFKGASFQLPPRVPSLVKDSPPLPLHSHDKDLNFRGLHNWRLFSLLVKMISE